MDQRVNTRVSLGAGRHLLAIPGPSVMPERVLQAMHRSAPNIYTGELIEITEGMIPDLKAVARTKGDVAIYVCNGHGAWEAALSNVLAPGDRALIAATGSFGHGWAEVAARLGAECDLMDFGKAGTWDIDRVAEAIRADRSHTIKAVLCTHVDTSTSVRNDVAALRAVLDDHSHPALLMVDCIASIGCERFEMDTWGVDVAVSASQKGLMVPPGLGFVWFNERADAARSRLTSVSPYWDWRPRVKPDGFYQYFNGTAPTHHIYGLREALTMLLHEEGLEAAWARHQRLAEAIWAAMEAWTKTGPTKLIIADRALRSHAVTAGWLGAPDGTRLRDYLSEQLGVTLGIGLGMTADNDPDWHGFFRIGHMGHVNAHMVLGTLAAIEAGMEALDIPHGAGALSAAARVCAR